MRLLQAIQSWFRRMNCRHDGRFLEAIVREPMSWTRQARYVCPDCGHEWVTWQLPEEVTR